MAVGVDSSPSTLGAAAIAADNPGGLSSDYRGWTYDDRGLGIKLARLQAEGQLLHRKAARLTRLAAHRPARGPRTSCEAKIAVLDAHRTAVGVKRGKINRELAFHFSRQVPDYAAAAGAQVIAVEDLTALETRGHGRVNNNRAAQFRPPPSGRRPRAHRRGSRYHGASRCRPEAPPHDVRAATSRSPAPAAITPRGARPAGSAATRRPHRRGERPCCLTGRSAEGDRHGEATRADRVVVRGELWSGGGVEGDAVADRGELRDVVQVRRGQAAGSRVTR